MSADSCRSDNRRSPANRPGFTVVEMLVTLAIIITLVGLLLVGLTQASGAAQRAQTKFLLNSMASGLAQFKGDHGYLPPVLGDASAWGGTGTPDTLPGWSRDLIPSPFCSNCPNVDYRQDWYSVTSPAEYLLGYGDRTSDGYGIVGSFSQVAQGSPGAIESPPLGYRAPGLDGVWGAVLNPNPQGIGTPGLFSSRNPGGAGLRPEFSPQNPPLANNDVRIRGRIYGPYLELKDDNLLGGLRPDGTIARPEDEDYAIRPKVILDYWGTPIRYYRTAYVNPDPSTEIYGTGVSELSTVFAARPWEFDDDEVATGIADANGDTSARGAARSAGFLLLSPGANRQVARNVRFDENEFNADNIVEVGP